MQKLNAKQIIIAIVAILSFAIGKTSMDYLLKGNSNTLSEKYIQAANEVNKNCPMMLDKDTRLDNTIALPNNVFQYNYTLISFRKEEINVDQLKNDLRPSLLNNLKTNEQMNIFRTNKTTVNYYYKDKDGVFLFLIELQYEDYKS